MTVNPIILEIVSLLIVRPRVYCSRITSEEQILLCLETP